MQHTIERRSNTRYIHNAQHYVMAALDELRATPDKRQAAKLISVLESIANQSPRQLQTGAS